MNKLRTKAIFKYVKKTSGALVKTSVAPLGNAARKGSEMISNAKAEKFIKIIILKKNKNSCKKKIIKKIIIRKNKKFVINKKRNYRI